MEIINEVEQIVDEAFGDDLEVMEQILSEYHERAVRCGCSRCISDFYEVWGEMAEGFYKIEDYEEANQVKYEIEIYGPEI